MKPHPVDSSQDETPGSAPEQLRHIVVVDVETTGLNPAKHVCVEVAAVTRARTRGRRSYDGAGNPNWKGGVKRHPLIHTWRSMIRRCHEEAHKQYPDYGGRGITVCDRWRTDFWVFVADMGDRTDGASLDRIDNNSGYSRENCRWATPSEQAFNRRPGRRPRLDDACRRGHGRTAENTYVNKYGERFCRDCREVRRAAKRAVG